MQFHLLSFEGPDDYARAGGIAARITGLAHGLAEAGHETHLWFVGDPDLPGHDIHDQLRLHRWCQWISRYHPTGVYDGEEGKRRDYVTSLPPYLYQEVLGPYVRAGGRAVILAEEWHTVEAVLHLDGLLRQAEVREQVTMFWNANNTYAFDRIDWSRLPQAAIITTVSRYMKSLMQGWGVNPLVMPNGVSADLLVPPDAEAVAALRARLRGRTVVSKVARWHPEKRWLLAVETVGAMQPLGWRPVLIARGGVEAHGAEVLATAARAGLRVAERALPESGVRGLLAALKGVEAADVVSLRSPLDADSSRLLFHGSDAVLANSGHEPFGLVGLETMAAGGVACTGGSGEDYAIPGYNALVLETTDPREFLGLFGELRAHPARERALRRAGRATAQRYTWPRIVQRVLLPRVRLVATPASAVTVGPRHCEATPRGGRAMDDTQTQAARVQELTALRHRLERLEAVITSLPHAVCVLDLEGRITLCNAAFAQLTGARIEALLGRPATALYGPEAASVLLERGHEAFVGEPVPASLETELVRTDGTRVPVELAVTDVTLHGQRTGCLAVVRDLRSRRQAEDSLRTLLRLGQRLHATSEPEPLLASLVEAALALTGAEGGCAGLRTPEGLVCRQYLRPPEILPLTYCWPPGHGLPGWLLVHKRPYLTNDAATDPQIVPAVRDAFGVRSALGTPILDRHGEILGFFALHNKGGPAGFTPVDRDIAVAVSRVAAVALQNALAYPRLQQAEEAVQRADHLALLGRLAASVAHEIRNPLQAMMLHVDILAEEVPHLDPDPRAPLAASLVQIKTELDRLGEIVEDYLSLARLSALQRTPTDLGPLVEGVAAECREACAARGITLRLEGLSQLGRAAVHPGTFRRALLNLVQNALEAMPQGGVLTLRGRGAGDRVQLEIGDTGYGIAPDQLPRLFAPFHTTKPQGTGLGLYVTREIVAAHSGEIDVHSAPGAGTTVTLTLPTRE